MVAAAEDLGAVKAWETELAAALARSVVALADAGVVAVVIVAGRMAAVPAAVERSRCS